MKNVILRAVVPICTRRQFARYATTLALGLPAIVLLAHLFDPAAPIGYIVLPVLAGGLLPIFALAPRRPNAHVVFKEEPVAATQALQRQPA